MKWPYLIRRSSWERCNCIKTLNPCPYNGYRCLSLSSFPPSLCPPWTPPPLCLPLQSSKSAPHHNLMFHFFPPLSSSSPLPRKLPLIVIWHYVLRIWAAAVFCAVCFSFLIPGNATLFGQTEALGRQAKLICVCFLKNVCVVGDNRLFSPWKQYWTHSLFYLCSA